MTNYEFALSDLAARLAGTDATLTTAISEILAAALQELVEAELTARIGAAPGERTPDRAALRNGHRPKLLSTPAVMSRSGSRSCAPGRSSRSCSSHVGGSTRPCGR
jgi:hypothetical protein